MGGVVDALIFIQDNGFKNILLDSSSIVFCGGNVKILDYHLANSKSYINLLHSLENG